MTAMPNLFAQIALYAWVPLGILFFRLFKPVTAATLTLLGASVVLPANFAVSPPGLPPVDRHVAGGIAALIGFFLFAPPETRRLRGLDWPVILILVLAISTFITTITNPDPLRYGDFVLPALSAYDALGLVFQRGLTIGVPFFVGMRLVRSTEDVLAVLRVIVILGLAYVPLVLWEARMSPQLHTTLYGYFPHDFVQHIRASGFRPVVFTGSGLECALFLATTVIAAVGLSQAQVKIFGLPSILAVLALFVGLVSCISLGPLLYGLLVPALMLSTKATVQAKVSLVLSFVIVFYPLLRSQDLFPTEVFVSTTESVSKDRASSLEFRFRNEDLLLERARDRLLFGWGSWGRSHVFDASTARLVRAGGILELLQPASRAPRPLGAPDALPSARTSAPVGRRADPARPRQGDRPDPERVSGTDHALSRRLAVLVREADECSEPFPGEAEAAGGGRHPEDIVPRSCGRRPVTALIDALAPRLEGRGRPARITGLRAEERARRRSCGPVAGDLRRSDGSRR